MTDNAEYVSLAFQTRAGDMRAGEKLAIALHDPLFFFLRLRGIPNRDIEDLAGAFPIRGSSESLDWCGICEHNKRFPSASLIE